ncbi:MAG TPA: hypothetical protein VHQ64_18405 [Pyrinomonadaceae bacterium]|nr:hypothetical protein [Pyrinomonadaceae bacterium]
MQPEGLQESGDPLKGRTWWFIKLFGAYFFVLFIPLLFLSLKAKPLRLHHEALSA